MGCCQTNRTGINNNEQIDLEENNDIVKPEQNFNPILDYYTDREQVENTRNKPDYTQRETPEATQQAYEQDKPLRQYQIEEANPVEEKVSETKSSNNKVIPQTEEPEQERNKSEQNEVQEPIEQTSQMEVSKTESSKPKKKKKTGNWFNIVKKKKETQEEASIAKEEEPNAKKIPTKEEEPTKKTSSNLEISKVSTKPKKKKGKCFLYSFCHFNVS